MLDSFGRNINKLRVSLGESCNMACTYCVTSIKDHIPDPNALSSSDLLKLVSLLVRHSGIAKIRITGGEPLLHRDLLSFIAGVRQQGVESIGLTTNGLNLSKLASPWPSWRRLKRFASSCRRSRGLGLGHSAMS